MKLPDFIPIQIVGSRLKMSFVTFLVDIARRLYHSGCREAGWYLHGQTPFLQVIRKGKQGGQDTVRNCLTIHVAKLRDKNRAMVKDVSDGLTTDDHMIRKVRDNWTAVFESIKCFKFILASYGSKDRFTGRNQLEDIWIRLYRTKL